VGTAVTLKHLAPTPEGQTVKVRVEIDAVDGNLIQLKAEVWDKLEKIGEATHTRAVIDVDRFLKRVNAKRDWTKTLT
jgi:predicted thioesterase